MPSNQELLEENAALKKALDRLSEGAAMVAVVIFVGDTKCVVSTGCGPSVESFLPDFNLRCGDTVIIHPQTGQILDKAQTSLPGSIAIVFDILEDGNRVEIEGPDMHKTVAVGPAAKKLAKGCRVMLDATGHIALLNLGRPGAHLIRGETAVTWNDIGGLEDIKAEIIEAIEYPHLYPDIFKSYNKSPPKGFLLQGPPGNGKTMLGKAIATSFSNIYEGKNSKKLISSAFLYVKGPEILTKWVGESESKIREIFERAREHKREYNFPATIFIDEAESILAKRGSGISSDIEKTIVPSFLSEMDGLDDAAAIVILATNRANLIDSAIMRDGRIDRKFQVPRPNARVVNDIMLLYLNKVPLASSCGAQDLAEIGTEALFSDDRSLGVWATKGKKLEIFLRDTVSGAMCKNIVDLAVASAIRRDIQSGKGKKPQKASGVNERDMVAAVMSIEQHAAHMDHSEVVEEVKERAISPQQESQEPKRIAATA